MQGKMRMAARRRMASISAARSGFSIKIPLCSPVRKPGRAALAVIFAHHRLRDCTRQIWQYCDNFLAPDELLQLVSEFPVNEQNQNRGRRGGELLQFTSAGN